MAAGPDVGRAADLAADGVDHARSWTDRSTDLVRNLADAARSARRSGPRRWLEETTVATAERLRPRDRGALARHLPGLEGDALAGALIRQASIATAAVGGATGAVIAAEQLLPTAWATIPFEVAAETALVVGVELKLVGELHAAAERPLEGGGPAERSLLLLGSWIEQRGVTPAAVLDSAHDLFGRGMRDQAIRSLRDRLSRRFGRGLSTAIPMLVGAAAGAELNRRATRAVGQTVAADLGLR